MQSTVLLGICVALNFYGRWVSLSSALNFWARRLSISNQVISDICNPRYAAFSCSDNYISFLSLLTYIAQSAIYYSKAVLQV